MCIHFRSNRTLRLDSAKFRSIHLEGTLAEVLGEGPAPRRGQASTPMSLWSGCELYMKCWHRDSHAPSGKPLVLL